MKDTTYDNLSQHLAIDEDDLADCLAEQADLFEHVGQACVMAEAARDALKLELDELCADFDKSLRDKAFKNDEKMTEESLKQAIRRQASVKGKHRQLLEAKREAARWENLRLSFRERSEMLRSLVNWKVAQMRHLGMEDGVKVSRNSYVDARVEQEKSIRRRERLDR
jgi:hypothetical protein